MNENQTRSCATRSKQALFLISLFILSALVLGSFIRTGDFGFERASFNGMVDGTAWKPFVYRMLAPRLIRYGVSILPDFIRDRLDVYAVLSGIRFPEFVVAVLLLYLSILGFAWAFIQLGRSLYRLENDFLYVATLAVIAGLPIFFKIRLCNEFT